VVTQHLLVVEVKRSEEKENHDINSIKPTASVTVSGKNIQAAAIYQLAQRMHQCFIELHAIAMSMMTPQGCLMTRQCRATLVTYSGVKKKQYTSRGSRHTNHQQITIY